MTLTVITGANRGIGYELARQAAERGDRVVAACRRSSDALSALDVEVVDGVDVGTDAGAARLAEALGDRTVDILVNNAGILTRETLDDLDFERMRAQYEVNALGPLRVTKALLGNLKAGSKVAIVSSRVGSMADNGSGGNYGYRMSKAAVNSAGVNLHHDLSPKGIPVVLLHPGYVGTEMTRGQGPVDPADAAQGLLARIDEVTLETSGQFRHAEGQELPW
jgi:NAD(P)-dependent dehydrogenase (short-subunit alcohol dehydrogenase family)